MVHNQQRVSEDNHFLPMFFQVYVRPDLIWIFSLLHNMFHSVNIFVIAGTNKMFKKWQNVIQFCMNLSHHHSNIVTNVFWVRKKVAHEMVKIDFSLGIITGRNGYSGMNKVGQKWVVQTFTWSHIGM